MLLACPTCSTAYEVPEERLKPGRKVRCAQCRTQWVPVALAPTDDPEPTDDQRSSDAPTRDQMSPPLRHVSAMDRLAAVTRHRQSDLALPVAWAASVIALLALATAAYLERDPVVRLWPATARLYAAPGVGARATGAVPEVVAGGNAEKGAAEVAAGADAPHR